MAQGGDGRRKISANQQFLYVGAEIAARIVAEAADFESELSKTVASCKSELMSLPACDSPGLLRKSVTIADALDKAKSSGEELKRRCDALAKKWKKFLDELEKSNPDWSRGVSVTEIDQILQKVDKLLEKCSDCERQFKEVRLQLSIVSEHCSKLMDDLSNEVKRAKKEEKNGKLAGYSTAAAKMAFFTSSGASALPAAIGAIRTAFKTKKNSEAQRQLSDTLKQAREEISVDMAKLGQLSDSTVDLENENKSIKSSLKSAQHAFEKEKRKQQKSCKIAANMQS